MAIVSRIGEKNEFIIHTVLECTNRNNINYMFMLFCIYKQFTCILYIYTIFPGRQSLGFSYGALNQQLQNNFIRGEKNDCSKCKKKKKI